MKTLLALAIVSFLAVSGRADADPKAALIHEFIQIQGVDEIVHNAKSESIKQAKASIQQMFEQIKTGLPSLPKEKWDAIRTAAEKMMQTVESSWSPEEAIRVYEEQYAADFTLDELQQLLNASKTPLGRKQTAAGKRANAALQQFLIERSKTAMTTAVQEYVADIQKIIAQPAPTASGQ